MLQRPRIRFKLSDSFIDEFAGQQPEWGPLGYVTYKRSYARETDRIPERCSELAARYGLTTTEEFWLTCVRVVEGVFNVQKAHCEHLKLPWDNVKAQNSAQEMFRRMWQFKWTPPGRGLYMMGTDLIWEIGGAPLINCAFISTRNLKTSFSEPFSYIMDMSMLGVGVGFDTQGAGSVLIRPPKFGTQIHVCDDSREGWGESTSHLLEAFVGKKVMPPAFSYVRIRDKGAPIKRFGGTCPGPGPLFECHKSLIELYYNGNIQIIVEHEERSYGEEVATLRLEGAEEFEPYHISSTQIVDTANIVGKCVVAGGKRRTAELAIGQADDTEFMALKQDQEKLDAYRWASNNSILAEIGMDYSTHASLSATNGEPGYLYLENARKYGRLSDPPNTKDERVEGWNPCFHEHAPLLTPNGIRYTRDIKVGNTVWTGSRWSQVIAKHDSGVQDTFQYKTAAGSFWGTENHKVFTAGERVEVGSTRLIDVARGSTDPLLLSVNNLDVSDGVVLGLGQVKKDLILIQGTNKTIVKLYEPLLHKFIDQERTSPLLNWHIVRTQLLQEELQPLSERTIPFCMMQGKPSTVASILRGLFSAKGKCSKMNGSVALVLHSKVMAEQVQLMLSSIGIRSFLKTWNYHSKEAYRVVVSSDILRFSKLIGFVQADEQLKLDKIIAEREIQGSLNSDTSSMTYKIREIVPTGEAQVYDITVDDEEHALWCGGLHVANCGEITLESGETCNVPETFPVKHESLEDYLLTLKYAYMYGKTVSLIPSHNEKTNMVQMRNRRIGLSQGGIVENINHAGFREHMRWCDEGYKYVCDLDIIYSNWLCVPRSIKKTAIKPGGTTPLMPGLEGGMKWPEGEYFIRNIRAAHGSSIIEPCREAGYLVEEAIAEPNTVVISFPVAAKHFGKSKYEVTIWEQLELAAQLQAYWADNSVSCTITVREEEKGDIARALAAYETRLKGVAFMPVDHGFKQAPYITITKEQYEEMTRDLKPLDLSSANHEVTVKYCSGDACELPKPGV
jgi:hypothetical protein